MQTATEQHFAEPVLKHTRTDFVRLRPTQTVAQALAHVQQSRPTGRIVYFYVVDEQDHLQGVLPTRRLLLSTPDTPIDQLMVKNVVTLRDTATLLDACEFFIMHKLLALPVVDKEGCIVGVVDVELYTNEISELAHRDESDDVFQLIGVRMAEVQKAPIPAQFGRRFPWLLCNIFGGIACAIVAGQFEDTLQRAVALSLFIPVVLAVAESVSIQTLSIALQTRHTNRFVWRDAAKSLMREIPVGAMLGAASGILMGVVVAGLQYGMTVALVICLAITLAVTTAATLGLAVPTVLHVFRRDPKLASGPIVLTLTDLCTLSYYLGLATWML